MNARFFRRVSDNAWLRRVDTGRLLSLAEAELHCAAEYNFPVLAVDELNITLEAFDSLRAQRMAGAVMPPVQAPPALTPDQIAWASATTIPQLKAIIGKRLGLE